MLQLCLNMTALMIPRLVSVVCGVLGMQAAVGNLDVYHFIWFTIILFYLHPFRTCDSPIAAHIIGVAEGSHSKLKQTHSIVYGMSNYTWQEIMLTFEHTIWILGIPLCFDLKLQPQTRSCYHVWQQISNAYIFVVGQIPVERGMAGGGEGGGGGDGVLNKTMRSSKLSKTSNGCWIESSKQPRLVDKYRTKMMCLSTEMGLILIRIDLQFRTLTIQRDDSIF